MMLIREIIKVLLSVVLAVIISGCCDADDSCWRRTIVDGSWSFEDIDGFSASKVYSISSITDVYAWDGTTWQPMSDSPAGDCILSFSEDDILVASNGVILQFDGFSWKDILRTPYYFKDFWGFSENSVFVAGYEQYTIPGPIKAKIFNYNGTDWTEMTSNVEIPVLLQGIWGSSPTDVYAVGTDEEQYGGSAGKILHYDGSNWSVVKEDISYGLYGIWGSSSEDVFAVGGRGHVLHFNGSEWNEMETPAVSKNLYTVWGSSFSEVYAAGDTVLFYNGYDWLDIGKDAQGVIKSIWGSSATEFFAVGYTAGDWNIVGTILEYTCPEPGMSRRP